jgi:hypothetical protein
VRFSAFTEPFLREVHGRGGFSDGQAARRKMPQNIRKKPVNTLDEALLLWYNTG